MKKKTKQCKILISLAKLWLNQQQMWQFMVWKYIQTHTVQTIIFSDSFVFFPMTHLSQGLVHNNVIAQQAGQCKQGRGTRHEAQWSRQVKSLVLTALVRRWGCNGFRRSQATEVKDRKGLLQISETPQAKWTDGDGRDARSPCSWWLDENPNASRQQRLYVTLQKRSKRSWSLNGP